MNAQPLVSIIVPIYNNELYLQQCLDSIINQSYRYLEIILINDGSKDSSLSIAQCYAENDSRIILIDKANEGVAATRNVGLQNAQGDYVLYVDSDDWIEVEMVKTLIKYAIKYDAPIVTCENVSKNKTDEIIIKQVDEEQTIKMFLRHKELDGSLWSKLIKRSLLNDIYFDPTIGYGEDALFFWQVLKKNHVGILYTNKQLYHYRMNHNSISHVFGKQKFTAYRVWTQITTDVEHLYPELLPLAKAQLCNQMAVILYEASSSWYPYDDNIRLLQTTIRRNFKYLHTLSDCSIKKAIGTIVLAWGYVVLNRTNYKIVL